MNQRLEDSKRGQAQGALFWIVVIATAAALIIKAGADSSPRSDSEFAEPTVRSYSYDRFDDDKEATRSALMDADATHRADEATYWAEKGEMERRYNEDRLEEAKREELRGMIEEAVRCSEPGAQNC